MNVLKIAALLIAGEGDRRGMLIYRAGKYLYDANFRILSRFFFLSLERTYGSYIHPDAVIGKGVKFRHFNGVVIGAGSIIGDNVIIYHQVTLGGARLGDAKSGNYPRIGNGTTIFAGAKLLGGIVVGEQCIIGANAVVIKDVPSRCLAVGVPAKVRERKNDDVVNC